MTEFANINFRITRLRYRMKGAQSDIRLLTSAGLDCAAASARLRLMQVDLLALIGSRDELGVGRRPQRRLDGSTPRPVSAHIAVITRTS